MAPITAASAEQDADTEAPGLDHDGALPEPPRALLLGPGVLIAEEWAVPRWPSPRAFIARIGLSPVLLTLRGAQHGAAPRAEAQG